MPTIGKIENKETQSCLVCTVEVCIILRFHCCELLNIKRLRDGRQSETALIGNKITGQDVSISVGS